MNKIGVNIHGENIRNKPLLIDRLKQLNPPALLVLDSLALAREIKGVLPNTAVIYRQFEHGEKIHEKYKPEEWLDGRVSHGANGVVIHVGNEMPFDRETLAWLLRVCKQAVLRNVTVCIGNWAVGNPEPDAWPLAKDLIVYANEHRDNVIVGLHEYAGGIITSGLIGGYPDNAGVKPGTSGGLNLIQLENWPTDISKITCYHMGRYKFLLDYCKSVGIQPPRIIITEAGFDDTSDIKAWEDTLKKTAPFLNIRGWKTLANQWREWFGAKGWSTDRAYAEQLIHSDRYWYQDATIEGRCVYCYGHSSAEWIPFDVEDTVEFWDMIVLYAKETKPAPVPMPPPLQLAPPAHDPRYEKYTADTDGVVVNVYTFARLVTDIVTKIDDGLEVSVILAMRTDDGWLPVSVRGYTGWVLANRITLIKPKDEPQVNDENPDAELLQILQQLVAALNRHTDTSKQLVSATVHLAAALERQSEIESTYLVKPAPKESLAPIPS